MRKKFSESVCWYVSEKVRGMFQACDLSVVGVHLSARFLHFLSFPACWLNLVV